jgi:hypothetical protein
MTQSVPTDPEQIQVPPRSARNMRLGCSIAAALLLVVILIPVGMWIVFSLQSSKELAAQVAKVRARGEPLTTVELNDYYKPAAGRPDMTAEIVAALGVSEDENLKALAKELPIVGTGPEPPLPPDPWPQLTEVEAHLARHVGALKTFHELARRDGTARFPVDFSPGLMTLLPHVQSMRHGARLLSLQFYVDLHRGRPGDAVDCILAQLALARALDQEPTIISQLVRVAIVAVAIANLQTAMPQQEFDDADSARVQEALRRTDVLPCLKRALAGERTFNYMVCIEPNIAAEGAAAPTPQEAREISKRPPSRTRDAAKLLEHNLRISVAADESLSAALRESQLVDAELQTLGAGLTDKFVYTLTSLMSPAYTSAIIAFARSAVKRDSADAALAAEHYRHRHGKWPDTLEQLVPEFLPAVPTDAYTGEPLKFVIAADELKVYSVGKDREDNQGNLSVREDPHTDMGFAIPTARRAP